MTLKQTKQRGFTIVELLIVVVIIAILAAITIVAYNGIQNRAKSSAAQSLANNVVKKAEAYNTINSGYAADTVALKAGAGEAQLDTNTSAAISTTAPTDEKKVQYQGCDTGKGAKVTYYDINKSGGAGVVTVLLGTTQATCSTT